jgi:outer membrane lipoprotein-sorting protein
MEGELKMKISSLLFVILTLALSAPFAVAQEMTTAQVLAKLDEKAKAFSTFEASLQKEDVVYGSKTVSKGKILMKANKNGPSMLLDITDPKREATRASIKDGNYTIYFPPSNGYRRGSVDPKNEQLQQLLVGFGVPAATLSKVYTPKISGRETIDGVQTVVLELASSAALAGRFEKVTLWLNPQTWVPVQSMLTEAKTKDMHTFKYSQAKLNKGISDSVFNLKIPSNATKQ